MIFDAFGNEFMNVAYLLIGGNMGDRVVNLSRAKEMIEQNCGAITAQSHIYQTAAWGLENQPDFLNQAVEIRTGMEAEDLLKCLLAIEQQLGRVRQLKYGPRLIDIDILLFNKEVIHTEGLKVPHPELPKRRFALQCLADIAPDFEHPELKRKIKELLVQCTDPLEVNKFY